MRIFLRPKRSAIIAQNGPKSMRANLLIELRMPSIPSPTPKAAPMSGKKVLISPPSELSTAWEKPMAAMALPLPLVDSVPLASGRRESLSMTATPGAAPSERAMIVPVSVETEPEMGPEPEPGRPKPSSRGVLPIVCPLAPCRAGGRTALFRVLRRKGIAVLRVLRGVWSGVMRVVPGAALRGPAWRVIGDRAAPSCGVVTEWKGGNSAGTSCQLLRYGLRVAKRSVLGAKGVGWSDLARSAG